MTFPRSFFSLRAAITKPAVLLVGFAAGLVAPGTVPLANALDCEEPPVYAEIQGQIDEVWTSEAFDCLVVQHEFAVHEGNSFVNVSTDLANACGEDLWVRADADYLYTAGDRMDEVRVEDGELVTVRASLEMRPREEGQGELIFEVLPDAERDAMEADPDAYVPLSRLQYSYSGTLYDMDDWPCSNATMFGCSSTASSPEAPAQAPLSWVMVGLGMVWLGRRARRSARVS